MGVHSYFGSRGHPVATVCFNSNHPTVWMEKSRTGFQDGGYEIGSAALEEKLFENVKGRTDGRRDARKDD